MSTQYPTKHGRNLQNTINAIGARQSFNNSSRSYDSLWARTSPGDVGYLRGPWLDLLVEDRPTIEYVVYSYATPIAWWSKEHGWRMPDIKYSVTTSRHQSLVRRALAEIGAVVTTQLAPVVTSQASA